MPKKLTKTVVDGLKYEPGCEIAWDTEIPGFGARITKTGRRTYFLKYRTDQGTQRKPKIGDHGPMTCDQARAIARHWYNRAKSGGDPSAERTAARKGETIRDLVERYRTHSQDRKRRRSVEEQERLIRNVLLPKLGSKKVAEISKAEISAVHASLVGTPYKANRLLALISHMMTMAMKWGTRPEGFNPCKGIDKFKETPRNRYLTPQEIETLFTVLDAEEETNPILSSFLRLLVLTGARRNELLELRWADVELPGRRLNLADSKTGPKSIILSDDAAKTLARIPKIAGNPFVFAGAKQGQPYAPPKRYWSRIRQLAGLPDVRLHDLRHTFASIAAQDGVSLYTIGKLMGHKDPSTTARYAHLSDDALRSAANQISAAAARKSPERR